MKTPLPLNPTDQASIFLHLNSESKIVQIETAKGTEKLIYKIEQ